MHFEELVRQIPDYAKDLRLNLKSVLGEPGAAGLSRKQALATAVASALAAGHEGLATALTEHAGDALGAEDVRAAHAAAAIMGMNNVYYRFVHLVEDPEYAKMPAGLRMRIIAEPGVDKLDFELYSLAVSAVNGCGACISAHERTLRRGGVTRQAIQSAARIAAVVHGVAGVLRHSLPARTQDRAAA